MPERSGGVYKKVEPRPYTRKAERVPSKCYVKGVPSPKIHLFETGDVKGTFDLELSLVSENAVQIKHNALEAARVAATKALTQAGVGFFLKVLVYPHHVLRENPMATGAGADRFQEGMSRSFGKPIGTSARIRAGQRIIALKVKEESLNLAKDALRRAKMKFPVTCRILIQSLKKVEKL